MITTIEQLKKINEKKESAKQKFISNKIRTLMDEGKEHKQAVAIAISMWEQKQKKKKSKNESLNNNDLEITITKNYEHDRSIKIKPSYSVTVNNSNGIDFSGTLREVHGEFEFETDWFSDQMSEDFYDDNYDDIEAKIFLKFNTINEVFSYDDEITITKELAVDIIVNHMQHNKLFKNLVLRKLDKDIESNKHLKDLLSKLDEIQIETLLLKI